MDASYEKHYLSSWDGVGGLPIRREVVGQKERTVMASPDPAESHSRFLARSIVVVSVLVTAIATTAVMVRGNEASGQGAPSDPRAQFIAGNVAPGDCRGLGTPIPESAITFTITNGQILTITAVDPAFVVVAIYVKGGSDTNLYQPGQRGLPQAPPWINLISPLTGGGQLPAISHWFACGSGTPPTTTTTAPTTTTTAPTTTTTAAPTTTLPGTTTTAAVAPSSVAATTTVPSGVSPSSVEPGHIPRTGSSVNWLYVLGFMTIGVGLLVYAVAWPRRSER